MLNDNHGALMLPVKQNRKQIIYESERTMQTITQPSTPAPLKTNWPHVAWFLGLTFGLTYSLGCELLRRIAHVHGQESIQQAFLLNSDSFMERYKYLLSHKLMLRKNNSEGVG